MQAIIKDGMGKESMSLMHPRDEELMEEYVSRVRRMTWKGKQRA